MGQAASVLELKYVAIAVICLLVPSTAPSASAITPDPNATTQPVVTPPAQPSRYERRMRRWAERVQMQALAAAEKARAVAIRARRGRPGHIKGLEREGGHLYWGERFRVEGETFFGEVHYNDGWSYRGEFQAVNPRTPVASGYGVMVFPNGNRYVGRFKENRPVGAGVRVDADAIKWFVWPVFRLAQLHGLASQDLGFLVTTLKKQLLRPLVGFPWLGRLGPCHAWHREKCQRR